MLQLKKNLFNLLFLQKAFCQQKALYKKSSLQKQSHQKNLLQNFKKKSSIVSFRNVLSSKTFVSKKSNSISFFYKLRSESKSVLSTESCLKTIKNFCVLSCLHLNAVCKKGGAQRFWYLRCWGIVITILQLRYSV